MDGWPTEPDKQRNSPGRLDTRIDCPQINLRHSKIATNNLQKIIDEERTDIMNTRTIHHWKQSHGTTTIIRGLRAGGRKETGSYNNKKQTYIDTILLNQLSDEDVVVVEIGMERVTLIIVSMYFDINRPIDIDLQKIQTILTHAKGVGIIFEIDSNARSTSWHGFLTNNRGKKLEESVAHSQ